MSKSANRKSQIANRQRGGMLADRDFVPVIAQEPRMDGERPIAMLYVGRGTFQPGVPARNLTPEEVERFGEKWLAGLKDAAGEALYMALGSREVGIGAQHAAPVQGVGSSEDEGEADGGEEGTSTDVVRAGGQGDGTAGDPAGIVDDTIPTPTGDALHSELGTSEQG